MQTREEYAESLFVQEDDVLKGVIESIAAKGMKQISVDPLAGKLLYLLIQISGAKRAVEIGALGGYSGVWMTRALPEGGRLVSLELLQEYADLAHENVKKAGRGDYVEYRVGPALDSLQQLEAEGQQFDLFFIDADKENYSNYLDMAIKLGHSGTLIIADNVLWSGRVLDPAHNPDSGTQALAAFNKRVAEDDRLEAVLLPFADGILVARVK